MTEKELAALLRALAGEAASLRKLLSLCAAAGLRSTPAGGPWMEAAIADLEKLTSRAEALAVLVVLS